ncbi:MAG: hypothetical protein IPN51_03545 [Chloracidobacterium sp.]|nr:hypothetical protein [Chloracidobacterium sp.]
MANARFYAAIGDGAADNIGSDCINKANAALMVGTSAAMRVAHRAPPQKIPAGLWCYRIDRKRVIVGQCFKRRRKSLRSSQASSNCRTTLTNCSPSIPKDALVVIPFFHGERSTGYDENARGAIIGMSADDDGSTYGTAMEGVAFRLADIFEQLKKIAKIELIAASGGALRDSPVWDADNSRRTRPRINRERRSGVIFRGAVLPALESIGKYRLSTSENSARFTG